MKVFCCVCGKQVVSYQVARDDECRTIAMGSKAGLKSNECFCGYCAEELDENGNFPEENTPAGEEKKS